MSGAVHIPDHERGRLHVFAVNMPPAEIRRRHDTGGDDPMTRLRPADDLLADLTGDATLDADGAELLAVADLEGFGLTGYLAEGHQIDPGAITQAAARLKGIDGFALILHSQAFGGHGREIGRGPALSHIASFDVPGADWTPRGAIETESAQPYSGPAADAAGGSHRMGSGLLIVVLAALAAGLFWVLR